MAGVRAIVRRPLFFRAFSPFLARSIGSFRVLGNTQWRTEMNATKSCLTRSDGTRIFSAIAVSLVGTSIGGASAHAADKSWNAGAGFWNTPAAWLPAGVPGPADIARLGNTAAAENASVLLTSPIDVASLVITDGMQLVNQGWSLDVAGATVVSGANPNGQLTTRSTLWLEPVDGNSFIGSNVQVLEGGRIYLDDAFIAVHQLLTIDPDSRLEGRGNIHLTGDDPKCLINDGRIDPSAGDLALVQNGDGLIDLDGTAGNGIVSLTTFSGGTTDSLTVAGTSLFDTFSGEIFMRGGAALHLNLSQGWTADAGSIIDIFEYPGDSEPAVIGGGAFTLAGTLEASYDLEIQAPATIASTAAIEIGIDDLLNFAAATTVQGGAFAMMGDDSGLDPHGAVHFDGPVNWAGTVNFSGIASTDGVNTVASSSMISASQFNMDGNGSAVWQINAPLVINAAHVESATSDSFDGTLNIANGIWPRLTIQLADPTAAWTMNGQLSLTGDNVIVATRVAGSAMRLSGDLSLASGKSQIEADLEITNSASVALGSATADLRVQGVTRIADGAIFSGSGTMRNGANGEMTLENGAALASIALVNQGDLVIGEGPAIAAVDRFENQADGVIHIEIGGYFAGSEHDRIVVSGGAAALAGALALDLIDTGDGPFIPQVGDEFAILTAINGITGTFVSSSPTSCAFGRTFQWTVLYGPNDVRVRLDAISECCPPDLDRDGIVGLQDLATLLGNFGSVGQATQPMGDIDFDGDVDLQDLALLLAVFGTDC